MKMLSAQFLVHSVLMLLYVLLVTTFVSCRHVVEGQTGNKIRAVLSPECASYSEALCSENRHRKVFYYNAISAVTS